MKEIILGNWMTGIDDLEIINNEDLVMSHKMAKNLLKMTDGKIAEDYQKRIIKKLDVELERRNISVIEGRYFINEEK